MTDFSSPIADSLRRYRQGDRDGAFVGLLEESHDVLPELMAAFRSKADRRVQAFLVEVIWQYRQQSVIPFLGEALRSPEPLIWKQALDGLVALASPAALEVLRSARQSAAGEFCAWLDEAIEQAQQQTPKA